MLTVVGDVPALLTFLRAIPLMAISFISRLIHFLVPMKGQSRGRPLDIKTVYSLLYVLSDGEKGLNQICRELAELRGWRAASKTWVLSALKRLSGLGLLEQDERRKWRIVESKRLWVTQFFLDGRFQDWLIYKLSTINPIFTFGPEAGKRFREVIPPPRNIHETIRLYGFVHQILLGQICPACIDEGWVTRMKPEIKQFGTCKIFECKRGHAFKVDGETETWLEALHNGSARESSRNRSTSCGLEGINVATYKREQN